VVRKTKETLDDKITLNITSIDLPRNGVIEKIALLFDITLHNAGSSAWNGTYEDVLKAIEEIRVVADANDTKYALNGLDVAIMNYYDSASRTLNPEDPVSVGAGADKEISFMLFLDAGRIHALAKEQLKLFIKFNTKVATDVSINGAEVTVTLDKLLFADAEEWYAYFNGVFIEPKVWTDLVSFDQLSELKTVMNIPTGTISWRGFLIVQDSSGARADIIDKYAIKQTKPADITLMKVDWRTGQHLDKVEYMLDAPLTGVNVIDYDKELIDGGFNLINAEIGVFKLALKTTAQGRLRYLSHELVVL